MGSTPDEAGRYDLVPVHRVKISKAFYLGKYEVTQRQWREVMANNPSNFNGDNLPVVGVSWENVQGFIKKLNEKEGINKYRLPSEAEWEYAARAGTTTRFCFSNDESNLDNYDWYKGNSGSQTHEVGQKLPNPWGLYDIHGNINELVHNEHHDNLNGAYSDTPRDVSAHEVTTGGISYRVYRGGSWSSEAKRCQSANRFQIWQFDGVDYVGFRVVRDL